MSALIPAEVVDFAQTYAQPILFGVGAVGALLAVLLVWRFLRTGHAHTKLGRLAVTLATAFAVEGMYEVASGSLHLNLAGSLMFCATFEIVMLHQGSLAAHKLNQNPGADIRRHMNFVWLVAVASGVVASTASDSLTEVVLRLVTPPLAAGIWYMSLYADKQRGERQPSRWIWTPQRLGIHLGLLKPGDADDLGAVFRQRRIDRMVRIAGQLDRATGKRAGKLSGRLSRLAQRADAQMLDEVRERYQRGATVRAHIFGAAHAQPDRAPEPEQPRIPAQASLPQLARLVAQVDAPLARRGAVVMRRPAEAPADDREAALNRAAAQVLARAASVRGAAKSEGVPESTLRTRLKTNGHAFEPAAK